MTEQERTTPGKFDAKRLIGGGVAVAAAGAVIFCSTALLGVNGQSSGAAFVPPGMRCDSPISCTEPVGTVSKPPSRIEAFVEAKTHDAKALAARAMAPESATAKHVPGSSTKDGCACPACCAASGGKGAITEARQQQEAQLLLDIIEADDPADGSTGRPTEDPEGRRDGE